MSLPAWGAEVRVFAAASLKNVLEAISADWESETGNGVLLTVASSSAVARQIEQGAPADIFISADMIWMNYLEQAGEIRSETKADIASNALVLIGPGSDNAQLKIDQGFALEDRLNGGRLAIGATESVPAGRYAKAALESLSLWDGVKGHLAEAENVRAALALVSRGEAPLGIVYATDARADPGVAVLGTFPESSHPPIIYPSALVAGSGNQEARAFLNYLQGSKAQSRFRDAGFGPPPPKVSN